MRPWLAAIVAFAFLGPYVSGSWEIAQEIDAAKSAPERLSIADVASRGADFHDGAWVQLDDAVPRRELSVRVRGPREATWTPLTGPSGEGLVIAYDLPPEPGPVAGLLYRARAHEVRDLAAAGFFGPGVPQAGPHYLLYARLGPDHTAYRQRIGVAFICAPVLLWALLWGIARAMKPRPPLDPTDVRWGTPLLIIFGATVLIVEPMDGPAPLALRVAAAADLAVGLAVLAFAGTRPVLAVANWLDGARARSA